MRYLLLGFFLTTNFEATAQIKWRIERFEWENKVTFDKFIKPEQWIGKVISFDANSISFDFSGIDELEKAINYKKCELFEPLDTVQIKDYREFMFSENAEKYLGESRPGVYLVESKPNCYKFPFQNFIFLGNKGMFRLRGVCFVLIRE